MTKFLDSISGMSPNVPQISLQPLSSLARYERNSRTHSAEQIVQIESLLLEYGWTNPALVDEMGIVAGHGRCMAAENIYKRGEQIKFVNGTPIPIGFVPTLDCSGWNAAQRRAYIIADNRSALSAGWDDEILALELRELDSVGFDLSLTAFSEQELDELMGDAPIEPEGGGDPDALPDTGDQQISVEGDLWVCGPHRVLCGDSTEQDSWIRLMQGERADVCMVDPPYGVDLERKNKSLDELTGHSRSKTNPVKNDNLNDEEFSEFIAKAYLCLFHELKPGATIYVFHSDKFADVFRNEFKKSGFKFSQNLIWRKNNIVLGPARYLPIHEPIMVGRKAGKSAWYGGRKQKTIIDLGESSPFHQLEDGRWQIRIGDEIMIVSSDATVEQHPSSVLYEAKPSKSGLHPTQKPVALCARMLSNSARRGDIVIDGFGGSGSTMIAADQLGMYARLCELDPVHVDTICLRYFQYSGRKPVHAFTGEEFPVDGEPRSKPEEMPDIDLF